MGDKLDGGKTGNNRQMASVTAGTREGATTLSVSPLVGGWTGAWRYVVLTDGQGW